MPLVTLSYKRTVPSILDIHSHMLSHLLAGPEETSCHVVRCPKERLPWQETEVVLLPVASKQLNTANDQESALGSGSLSPMRLQPRLTVFTLVRELEPEAPT